MFEFDPLSPEFQSNPYAYYHALQEAAPVFYWERWNTWFLSRYDDCVAGLRDARMMRESTNVFPPEVIAGWPKPPEQQRPLIDMQRHWMLVRDAPTHTRLRGLVHKAFTPRMVERMRANVEKTASNLLDAVDKQGRMDVVADLAFPLPVTIIAELLGVPPADRERFRVWSRDLAGTLELTEEAAVYDQGAAATLEFTAYLRKLVAERRKEPHEDLLSALVAAEEAGDRLTEDELIAPAILLLVAGHETTVNLIGSATLALLRHPDQLARMQADLSLTRNAVEEALRYDSPVQLTARLVGTDDVEYGGGKFKRGQQVIFLLGAANRDPRQFPDPDRFDITRQGADKHIGFGNGIHFCLGAPLARLEGEIALRMLFQRFPRLHLETDRPNYRPTYVLRGLEALPVSF